MIIEFVDLKKQYVEIKKEVDAAIARVVKSQYFILGDELEKFEEEFAKYLGCKYVVGVDNGSDALIFTMKVLNIGPGDEVITPINSYISTTFAITEVGATPNFVDVNPDTHQLDIEQVKKKITKKTKAILPVHLYGAPCEVGELVEICKKHKIHLVEDAAQAHGATYKGKMLGTFGIMGIYSFYPGKNLGAYGNGGAISTNDRKIYEKLLMLRNFGQKKRYYHEEIGYNSKLPDLQAAVLSVKLKHLTDWNKKRDKFAALYKKYLSNFKTHQIVKDGISNYHLFVIEVDKRDSLQEFLTSKGVKAQIHYPVPIHLQKCYQYLGYKKGSFPVAEKIAGRILSLPMHPHLTEKEVKYASDMVNAFYEKK